MTYVTPKDFIKNIAQVATYIELAGSCRKNKKTYYNEFGCFDIETTTINTAPEFDEPNYEAFMYVWQFYIAETLVIGRTWEEWKQVLEALEMQLNLNTFKRLVVFSHNLAFEFQFERTFFNVYDVFATSKREVVRCCISNGIEARCSYRLTNMNLARFLDSQPNVKHKKLSGEDFDYRKLRYPDTELTEQELEYCANDVIGLHEGLTSLLELEQDNLATVPYTSTGFVRRDFRKRMQTNKRNREIFVNSALTPRQYGLCRTATRGGNCHANPTWSNRLLHRISSFDMTSAYPAVMIQTKFPMSKFVPIDDKANFKAWIANGFACLLEIQLTNPRVKTVRSVPYIPKAKCVTLRNPDIDNGRVLGAESLSIVLTDIDFNIIERTYTWDSMTVERCYISYYDYLPKELCEQVLTQFRDKCMLKHGDPYYYMKSKNRLNSDFGMMLTDICRSEVVYNPTEEGENPFTTERPNIEEALEKYYNNRTSFLPYQWGTWVTARCRERLQAAIDGLGSDMVYCDTDSAKYIGEHDLLFSQLNDKIREEAEAAPVRSTVDLNGERFELGVWEKDAEYFSFKTLGAKKYAYTYEEDGDVHITVAGLGKNAGALWLNQHGKMDAFKVGTLIPEGHSGRTVAKYNDLLEPVEKLYNGHRVITGSNVAIYDTTYHFSITDDYEELLEHIDLLV